MLTGLITFNMAKSKHRFFLHHILLILFFAVAYYISSQYITDSMVNHSSHKGNHKNSKQLSLWDCMYFSLVTQTTVGYGDISPTHPITKLINVIQLLTIYGVLLIEL